MAIGGANTLRIKGLDFEYQFDLTKDTSVESLVLEQSGGDGWKQSIPFEQFTAANKVSWKIASFDRAPPKKGNFDMRITWVDKGIEKSQFIFKELAMEDILAGIYAEAEINAAEPVFQ